MKIHKLLWVSNYARYLVSLIGFEVILGEFRAEGSSRVTGTRKCP